MLDIGFVNLKHPSVQIKQQLHRFARSRWALSTVVTTLIIIVISVLLASVVTYFAINVTSTRVQEESLALTKQHVWYDSSSGEAQAAIMVINAGGRDVVIDRLTVRGQTCAWSKVFYTTTSDSITGDLCYNSALVDGGKISISGSDRVFKQATSDLTLQSGKTLIIYMSNPDSISVNDIGLTVSVNIFTSQAMYYKETNVQGTGGTQTASNPDDSGNSDFEITYVEAYFSDTLDEFDWSEVAMVVTNSGSSTVTITVNDLIVKGQQANNLLLFARIDNDANSNLPCIVADNDLVQGSILNMNPDHLTIQAGERAIVYFIDSPATHIHSSDVDQTISVGINLGNGQSVTTQTTVHQYQVA